MKRLLALVLLLIAPCAHALDETHHVSTTPHPGAFALAHEGHAAPIYVDPADWPGVALAANSFAQDVQAVTNLTPTRIRTLHATNEPVVIIGTIGHSILVDQLIDSHKLDVSAIRNHWETSITQVIANPFPGISSALVIAGADKRGTIFGIYDLSAQIGVSPWAWWADVPIPHQASLFVGPGTYLQPEPRVKYRGIFLNDEAPALTGWTQEKFGGRNSKFYVHVFELLLRLKANFLWPAMWSSAFNEDDPLNPRLADEYGIVMGTSHHEPMMRAQQEWKRHGTGPWDYTTNANVLDDFWRAGVRRNKDYEQLTTIGMRGDGDMAMSADTNTKLLEDIVAKQRKILTEEVNPDITKIPQVWALYKEVQDYYEKGMRVPDDVTLLWCDDNWGNLRRLPTAAERQRPGGAGIYYHFDYVGDPRSYKWINTNSITRVHEQMQLAVDYGADRMWIVNVGDLKPMEFPIEFFLDMARTPDRFNPTNLSAYTLAWVTAQFGPDNAKPIAQLLDDYQRLISLRKPELISPTTFSLTAFDEANNIEHKWSALADTATALYQTLPEAQRPAFFELIGYEVLASANLTSLYLDAGRNQLYAKQGFAIANDFTVDAHMKLDADLSAQYNHLIDGRWNHMMDQTHIGYTSWNDPPKNIAPTTTHINVPEHGGFGVLTQVGDPAHPTLGTFLSTDLKTAPATTHTFTLFNKGRTPLPYTATASAPYIHIEVPNPQVLEKQTTLRVEVDWQHAPPNTTAATITIASPNTPSITLPLQLLHTPALPAHTFLETNGLVSIEAAHTTSRTHSVTQQWQELPSFTANSLGAPLTAMTVAPSNADSSLHSAASLNYAIHLYDSGSFTLRLTTAPTLNFVPGRGLRLALSIDDGPRMLVDTLALPAGQSTDRSWRTAVANNARQIDLPITIAKPGLHTLHLWAVDPALVLESLVLAHTPIPYSYLGPPESPRTNSTTSKATE